MKKYSANYSHSNHNFVIQNLKIERISSEYLPAIYIIKNILQRGKPTLLSSFLQEKLGAIHTQDDFNTPLALISKEKNYWNRVIRGDKKGNYYPAKKFYDILLSKYLKEYEFIQRLIIPEIPINDITQVFVDEFNNQQVDFYLPQAYLVIEIDGSHHQQSFKQDQLRDTHLGKYGIETIRIKTSDMEAENEAFLDSIEKIKSRIEKVISREEKRKTTDPTFISIQDYANTYAKGVNFQSSYLRSTAVLRFQILILELLENGILSFDKPWKIELKDDGWGDFAELAIEDLFLWFTNILQLHKIAFTRPEINVNRIDTKKKFSTTSDVKVDFSLLKRYTDEFQTNPDIIFVRTDYLDEYLYFKQGDAVDRLVFSRFEPYDYFRVSSTTPIKYKLKLGEKHSDVEPLLFLLWNIFLQHDSSLSFENLKFREGQLPIIANALSRNDTIGLLPTGSGKSVCY